MSEVYNTKLIAANRFPFDPETKKVNLGGLATALGSGQNITWVGASDSPDAAPTKVNSIYCVPAIIDPKIYVDHYEGAANGFIWPAFHGQTPPVFTEVWRKAYLLANKSFADAISHEQSNLGSQTNLIWIHDYHLFLTPGYLRDKDDSAKIGFFLHIPWPPLSEILSVIETGVVDAKFCLEIVKGILGSDLIGFHTNQYCQNFLQTIDYLKIAEVNSEKSFVKYQNRTIQVSNFPIGIAPKRYYEAVQELNKHTSVPELKQKFVNKQDKVVFVGVDRLDYTKGIDHRLLAFQQLLRNGYLDPARVVLIQVAAENRENIDAYIKHKKTVEDLVNEIRAEFGFDVLQYITEPIPLEADFSHLQGVARTIDPPNWPYSDMSVVELLSFADVLVVSAVRDGMNLVCKEFVAVQWYGRELKFKETVGSLILSDGAGAVEELGKFCHTHKATDIDDLASKMLLAYRESGRGSDLKRLEQMDNMAQNVLENNTVKIWRDNFWSVLSQC